jgi:hypothetical protein
VGLARDVLDERLEVGGGRVAATEPLDPLAQHVEERLVADGPAQRVERERTTLVDLVS